MVLAVGAVATKHPGRLSEAPAPDAKVSENEVAEAQVVVSVCTIASNAVPESSYPVQHTGMMCAPVCDPVTAQEMVVADGEDPTFTTCNEAVYALPVPNSLTASSMVPVVEPVTVWTFVAAPRVQQKITIKLFAVGVNEPVVYGVVFAVECRSAVEDGRSAESAIYARHPASIGTLGTGGVGSPTGPIWVSVGAPDTTTQSSM